MGKWISFGLEADAQPLAQIISRAWREKQREGHRKRGSVRRGKIVERDGMICGICREDIAAFSDLHIDHIIPISKGGTSDPANLQPSHASCNLRKGSRG